MTRHTRTDPACEVFRPPYSWWRRWLFDRGRGRACRICTGHRPTCRYGVADCDCYEADR